MSKRRTTALFELGPYWLGREPGKANIYRYWYDGTGDARKVCRRSTGTPDFETAKQQLAAIVVNRPTVDAKSPENVFVIALLDHYWLTHSDAIPSAKQARRAGAVLLEWLVDEQKHDAAVVADLSITWQTAFIKWCATSKGHSVGYISRVMSMINAAVRHGVKRILVDQDGTAREVQLLGHTIPVIYKGDEISRITKLPESAPRDWIPTWEQLAKFIDTIGRRTAKGEWDRRQENLFHYVVVALNTWARSEAVLELHVPTQVDFDLDVVKLNPPGRRQNKKVRPTIPLTDNLRGWLQEWNRDYPVQETGKPLTTIKKVFSSHADAVGIPEMTPNVLRHFMATNVRRIEGCHVDREQREEWLGHKPQDTTSWYERYDPEFLREAKIATDRIMVRLNGMLKNRTLIANSSHFAPIGGEVGAPALKLVSSK